MDDIDASINLFVVFVFLHILIVCLESEVPGSVAL